MSEKKIIYYPAPGEGNTEKTIKAAKSRADELGIKNIVVALTRGGTEFAAMDVFKGYNVVVVTRARMISTPLSLELLFSGIALNIL